MARTYLVVEGAAVISPVLEIESLTRRFGTHNK
jgi:hypothetical protein